MIFMKSEKEIREKLKQIEDSIELEEKYEVRAPMVYYEWWGVLKWVLGERDTFGK